MPSLVVKRLEKCQRDFLWDGGLSKKDHLVKWDEVCKPKSAGDLGIGGLKKRNMTLLSKWLWRFSTERGNL